MQKLYINKMNCIIIKIGKYNFSLQKTSYRSVLEHCYLIMKWQKMLNRPWTNTHIKVDLQKHGNNHKHINVNLQKHGNNPEQTHISRLIYKNSYRSINNVWLAAITKLIPSLPILTNCKNCLKKQITKTMTKVGHTG